jgi:hypothetical protein
MTRNGKIARLPHAIREQLNQRIENGEQGIRLVEWLNTLPEVAKVLGTDFEGRPITEGNLTEWKNGGFRDWQSKQDAKALIEEWQSATEGSMPVPASELVEAVTTLLMTYYALAVEDSNHDVAEIPQKRLKRLGQSLRDVIRVRRYDLARNQAELQSEIGRERLTLERERLELERAKVNNLKGQEEPASSSEPPLSHEDKAAMVRQMLEDA